MITSLKIKINLLYYLLTPKGIVEKTSLAINFMRRKLNEYDELKKELDNDKKSKNIQLKNKQKNFFLDEYTSEVFLDKDFIIPIIEHKKITFDEVFIRKKLNH